MTVDEKALVAALRAEGTPSARTYESSDLAECERRVQEALHRARARQWGRQHWWGASEEEDEEAPGA